MSTNSKVKKENPMKNSIVSFVRKALTDQSGQTLPFAAIGMITFMGFAGLTVDVGRAYVVHSNLQNSTNAAALAAAGAVYDSQSASVNTTTQADLYSSGSGDENSNSTLGTVSTTVTTKCLNMLMPTGETCGTTSPANAVRVISSTSVKT